MIGTANFSSCLSPMFSERLEKNANKYVLMAEDWYVCNCNGDREYVPIIAGDSPEEVQLWAAAGGFAVRESPPTGFTRCGVMVNHAV